MGDMMNSTVLWVVVAVVVVLLVVVGILVVVGNNRKKSKTVSFDKKELDGQKELTQQEKSGNYQAKGGFNFAPAGAPTAEKEPVRVDEPLNPNTPAETEQIAPTPDVDVDPVAAGETETELIEPDPAEVEPLNAEKPAEPETPEESEAPAEPVADEAPEEPAEPVVEEAPEEKPA